MRSARGFTLIELLVVIAIISILAGIIVPNAANYIRKARVTRAEAEITGINTALTDMLADAGKQNFYQFFDASSQALLKSTLIYQHDQVFYPLLRQGRSAELPAGITLISDVRAKLGTDYLNLGKDPFGNRYQFCMGPWSQVNPGGTIPFRCWRPGYDDEGIYDPYEYKAGDLDWDGLSVDRKAQADEEIPGNPQLDGLPGFPAPKNLTVYVWSMGENMVTDQLFSTPPEDRYYGGGDDINNWDNDQGWKGAGG